MDHARARRLLALYFAAQSLATIAWWGWMFRMPESRDLFFAPGTADVILGKFSVPDILVFGGLGFATCALLLIGSRWAVPVAWATAGAGAYACFGAIMINWPIGQRPIADAMMALTMAGSATAAYFTTRAHDGRA